MRHLAPRIVLDGPTRVALEDTHELFHASLKLLELLAQCNIQVLHGGTRQAGVYLPEVL